MHKADRLFQLVTLLQGRRTVITMHCREAGAERCSTPTGTLCPLGGPETAHQIINTAQSADYWKGE